MLKIIKKGWLWFQTRVDALWGYDVFIAHRRSDAATYARSLYDALAAEGIASFIDEVVYGPGDSLLIWTQVNAAKSTLLLIVGSSDLIPRRTPEDWVEGEMAAYFASHLDNPKVVVVTFGSAVLAALQSETTGSDPATKFLAPLRPFLRITEPLEALGTTPSVKVIEAIRRQLEGRRRNRRRLGFFQSIAGLLAALLIAVAVALVAEIAQRARADAQTQAAKEQRDLAVKQTKLAQTETIEATKQRNAADTARKLAEERLALANSQVVAADARLQAPTELNAALRESADAYRIAPSDDARAALLDSLGRAAHVVRFHPCANGWKSGGVALSTDAQPAIAFSCLANRQSLVTIIDRDGRSGPPHPMTGEVRTMVFLTRETLAVDGASALRILHTRGGLIETIDAGKDAINLVVAGPTRETLLTVQAGSRIRVWRRGLGPAGKWNSLPTDSYSLPFRIADLAYSPVVNAMDIRSYDGSSKFLPVTDTAPLGTGVRDAEVTSTETDSACAAKYPMVTRTNWRVWSQSSDAAVRAYLTDKNNVVVERRREGDCTVLYGNTHNSQVTVSADGRWVATLGAYLSSDTVHGLILWDLEQVHPLAKVLWSSTRPAPAGFPFVALSYDGASWVLARPGGLLIWNGTSVDAPDSADGATVSALTLSHDGGELAVGYSNGDVARWTSQPTVRRKTSVRPGTQSIDTIWYVNAEAYAKDAAGSVWRISETNSPARFLPYGNAPSDACQFTSESGPELAVETQHLNERPMLKLIDTATGSESRFQVPTDSGSCASLAYSAGTRLAVRIPLEYIDMYIFEARKKPPFRSLPNPLHDGSGLRQVLKEPRIADDGTLMATIASTDHLALFDLATTRLLGTIPSPDTRALALSGNGKRMLTYNERIGVVAWDVDPDHWSRVAAEIAGSDPRSP